MTSTPERPCYTSLITSLTHLPPTICMLYESVDMHFERSWMTAPSIDLTLFPSINSAVQPRPFGTVQLIHTGTNEADKALALLIRVPFHFICIDTYTFVPFFRNIAAALFIRM